MNETYIKNVVEAALLAAGRPLQVAELIELFGESARPTAAIVRTALEGLQADYSGRGIEVKETATGFRIQVRRDVADEISRLWPERPPRYSRALLETLAIIAYRQPITRAEIEAVRGVAVNPNIIKTVLERNWVRVVGLRDVPGRPELLGTTREFLDYFGLRGLEDLPPLAELKAMGDINLQLDLAKEGGAVAAELAGVATGEGGPENGSTANDGENEQRAAAASADSSASGENASDAESTASVEEGSLTENDERDEDHVHAATAASNHSVEHEIAASDESGVAVETTATAESEQAHEERRDDEILSQSEGLDADAAASDDSDLDASGLEDDSGDDEELSAADPETSSELVAASRDLDD